MRAISEVFSRADTDALLIHDGRLAGWWYVYALCRKRCLDWRDNRGYSSTPTGIEDGRITINGHKWQFSFGDPRPDDFSETKLQRRQRRHIAVRTKVGIVCTIDKRRQIVDSFPLIAGFLAAYSHLKKPID